MSTKTWIIFAAVCALLFGGLIVWSQRGKIDVGDVNDNSILSASDASGNIADHVEGKKDSKVILIEYGDFQCPGCAGAHPQVEALMEKHGDKIAFVFRNYPLMSIHPNARAASAAAEAAGMLGKYWEMHDLLFEAQDEWSGADQSQRASFFRGYAERIGLDPDEFETILSERSGQINGKISFDQALGRKVGVTGTPSFFLNGTKVGEEVYGSEETFEKAILDELKKQGVEVEAKTEE